MARVHFPEIFFERLWVLGFPKKSNGDRNMFFLISKGSE